MASPARLRQITLHLRPEDKQNFFSEIQEEGGTQRSLSIEGDYAHVSIGDVKYKITPTEFPELVPFCMACPFENSQDLLRHLRWIMQKHLLNQDVFLLGTSASLRRKICFYYASLTKRPVEYIAMSPDITFNDLKQRREIRNSCAIYTPQACLRAALNGAILIIDGIEKAERNVLPVLNNLLENREMALEDGGFLTSAKRYDALIKEYGQMKIDEWGLKRCSQDFWVIALGMPVPPYPGYPLDPPLRSRFQARSIEVPETSVQVAWLREIAPSVAESLAERISNCAQIISSASIFRDTRMEIKLPEFQSLIHKGIMMVEYFPRINRRFVMDLLYPFPVLPNVLDHEQRNLVEETYKRFGLLGFEHPARGGGVHSQTSCGYRIVDIMSSETQQKALIGFQSFNEAGAELRDLVDVFRGEKELGRSSYFIPVKYHEIILAAMFVAHKVGDFCLIGAKGVGKSVLISEFAQRLGYEIVHIPAYKEMSARDFLQQRITLPNGDTSWVDSPLVTAALKGHIAVIDGADALNFTILSSLSRLFEDREISLPDGRRIYSPFDVREVEKIHPSFRIIVTGRPVAQATTKSGHKNWLSKEVTDMMLYVPILPLEHDVFSCC